MANFLSLTERWVQEQRRLDARTALVAYTVATMLGGGKKKNGEDLTLQDFMSGGLAESVPREQTAEEMMRLMEEMVAHGDGR